MNTMHRHRLLGASIAAILRGGLVASACTLACVAPVLAQEQARTYAFDIPAQDLGSALRDFARSSGQQVTFEDAAVRGKRAPALKGAYTVEAALDALIRGTGLEVEKGESGLFIVRPAAAADDARVQAPTDRAATTGEVTEMDTLVVTGTNIRGIAPDSSPLSIYTRDDIDRSGQGTVHGFLRTLPENFGGGATDQSAGGTSAPGAAYTEGTGVNLRGLGNDATLVLVNGRRVAPIGTGDFVDVSLVPTAAVARIDVLKDGASAIYGSDAIGGVVNIVLQDDYDGAETRLRVGGTTQGGGEEYGFGQTWGKAWSSGHALVSYDYHRRDSVAARDRDATRDAPEPLDLLPNQRRHGLFASAAQDVGDRVQLFGQFLYGDREYDSAVNASGQLSQRSARVRQGGLTLGLDADLDDNWRFELASSYNRSRTVGDTVFANFSTHTDRRSSVWATDAKLDGKAFRAPGGDARLAVGGQFREERYLNPRSDGSRYYPDRQVVAGFAEVFVPFVGTVNERPGLRRLELTAAVRHEDYSDFGRTTNPKLGLLWSPARGLNLRGTYGKSFRAPNFDELDDGVGSSILLFPLPDPLLGGAPAPVLLRFGMNGALGPERATTWTVGADWAPPAWAGFRAGWTWFSIDFRDRIGSVSTDLLGLLGNIDQLVPYGFRDPDIALIQELAAQPIFTNLCGCPPEDAVAFVDLRLNNLASDQVEGLDLDARYRWNRGDGQFEVSANATRLFGFERRSSPAAPEVDVLATVFNPPKWRVRAGLAWSNGRWDVATFVNHVGDYHDLRVAPTAHVGSWTTVDATVGFQPRGDSGLRLSLAAINLFDRDPPFIQDPLNNVHFDSANASALGRVVALQLSKAW